MVIVIQGYRQNMSPFDRARSTSCSSSTETVMFSRHGELFVRSRKFLLPQIMAPPM